MRICKICDKEKDIKLFRVSEGYRGHTCLDCLNLRRRKQREDDPERFRDYDRKKHYGLSPGVYETMLGEQDGVCFICRNPPGERSLNVDHSHETGQVRKLLCSPCNTGLGLFRDDPDLLIKAAAYLIDHKEID